MDAFRVLFQYDFRVPQRSRAELPELHCGTISQSLKSLQIAIILETRMLYTLISLLVMFWVLGLVAHIGGGFIHALLVVALCLFVFNVITGRRAGI